MTHLEYIALSMLTTLFILFILNIVLERKTLLLAILINSLTALLIYYILMLFGIVTPSRYHSLGVGAIGNLYLIAMIFMQ